MLNVINMFNSIIKHIYMILCYVLNYVINCHYFVLLTALVLTEINKV